MKAKVIASIVAFWAASTVGKAQFYTIGSDPGSIRWSQIETNAYKIIYPSGMDSLARVYAVNLESARCVVGNSVGFVPNESYKKKLPVILHNFSTIDNGVVTWAPRRVDILTVPTPYSPDAYPNESLLAIHESRHVAQMQFGNAYPFRWLHIVFGEMATGALSAIYPGPAFFEGDAVTAETALSGSGRGRNGDFLEYYRVSFDEGSYRNWWQWRWGSFNKYTPDYYRAGYVLISGMRTVYGESDFSKRYYDRIKKHHGFTFGNLQKTIYEVSGKSMGASFKEISDSLKKEWDADKEKRGPFPEFRKLTEDCKYFTSYRTLETIGENIYAVREGIAENPALVKISPDGSQTRISGFATRSSQLRYSESTGRLFWSEQLPDVRWELRSYSDILYTDSGGKISKLTSKERFFNPAPNDSVLAVVEYPEAGGGNLVIIDAITGSRISSIPSPDGMQMVEPVWVGGVLYVSAVVEEGFGIYDSRDFTCVIGPVRAKINTLISRNGEILFTSDANGVNELYSIKPSDGTLLQLSSTPNGAADFRFTASGDSLFCTILNTKGRDICVIPVTPKQLSSLPVHSYPVADKLTSGETELFHLTEVEMSEEKKYSKLGHLIKFHSWAPLYVNIDRVSKMSFESVSQVAGLGATALFQNELGTAWGSVAYHAGHSSDGWHHSGHANINYSGWYPVIQAGIDFGDRYAYVSTVGKDLEGKNEISTVITTRPFVSYDIKAYIPFVFNRGGMLRGLVPQVSFNGTNDKFEGVYNGSLSFSLRGYIMQRTPASSVYPRLGIGAELGYYTRPGLEGWFCPDAYAYIYAYLPGIGKTHGIRLSCLTVRNFATGTYVNTNISTKPRGFPSSVAAVTAAYPTRVKLTFDYALPFASLDWAGLSPLFYLRNLEIDPHADFSVFNTSNGREPGNLFSIGADFKINLSNFLWIPFRTKIGISYNYNGGSSYEEFAEKYTGVGRNSVQLVFSVDM